MTSVDMRHMNFIEKVANEDVAELRRKEATYQGSWKRRGGVGAFMMMARKWDRLEGMAITDDNNYDIFAMIGPAMKSYDGTALAEVRDLRRYLILIEAEMLARVPVPIPVSATAAQLARAAQGTIREIDPHFDAVLAGGKVYTRNGRGTSEDDGHRESHGDTPSCGDGLSDDHARHRQNSTKTIAIATGLEPWICGADYFARKDVPVEMRQMFWNLRAPGTHVLEPHVVSHGIPRVLRDLYHMRGETWTLRVDKCPPDARDMFPVLTREKNMMEHGDLPEWQRVLYTWNEEAVKFELTAATAAWAEGGES